MMMVCRSNQHKMASAAGLALFKSISDATLGSTNSRDGTTGSHGRKPAVVILAGNVTCTVFGARASGTPFVRRRARR